MLFHCYLKIAFQQIYKNKMRSFLTILGIIIGVAAMIAVGTLGAAGEDKIFSELEKFGINRLLLYPNTAHLSSFQWEDSVQLKKRIKAIETISPQAFWKGRISANGKTESIQLVGTTSVLKEVENKELEYGRFLNAKDTEYARNVIVLSEELAETLFSKKNALGKTVQLNGKTFTIIGIDKNTKPLYSAVVSAKSYIPISSFQNAFGSSRIDEISITVKNTNALEETSKSAQNMLHQKYGEESISVVDLGTEIQNAHRILETFQLVVGSIAMISLFVGGIGIMNIMLITINERIREIGIRKALGAKNRSILAQFLTEAFLYAMIGSVFGVILGIGFSFLGASGIHLSVSIAPASIFFSILFASLIGMLFGILPAIKAAHMDPVDALRHE